MKAALATFNEMFSVISPSIGTGVVGGSVGVGVGAVVAVGGGVGSIGTGAAAVAVVVKVQQSVVSGEGLKSLQLFSPHLKKYINFSISTSSNLPIYTSN
jgi:hypothetical protein